MPKRQIGFAESALTDLEEVLAWYAEQGVPAVGKRLVAEAIDRVHTLVDHPDMGRKVPEFDTPRLREMIHPPFRIVYSHDAKAGRIWVVRVWRSERVLKLP